MQTKKQMFDKIKKVLYTGEEKEVVLCKKIN